MARIIKFRAWDANKEKMVLPDSHEVDFINGELYVGETIEYGTHDDFKHFILMQFTGLQDKNGKDIYEGDIVKVVGYGVSIIVWNEAVCAFQFSYENITRDFITQTLYDFECKKKFEIIGNIWETPNLIKHGN